MLKGTRSRFKDYGWLILPLTLILIYGETLENGRNSWQRLSNPIVKSYY